MTFTRFAIWLLVGFSVHCSNGNPGNAGSSNDEQVGESKYKSML